MQAIVAFLQVYGWHVVGLVAVLYVAQDKIREHLLRLERRRSLETANDPSRIEVLDRERRRVRELQQKRFEETMKLAKKKKRTQKKVEKRTSVPVSSNSSSSSSSSFNHLLSSSSSGTSYKPRRRRRRGG